MNKKVRDYRDGDNVEGYFLVKDAQEKLGKNNTRYMDLVLSDDTGDINGKIWSCREGMQSEFEKSCVVKVRGTVKSWNSQLQINIEKIRRANEGDGVSISSFIASAPESAADMYNMVLTYIDRIRNLQIKQLVGEIIKQKETRLKYFPAAKTNHHAVRSGLLYHITTMLKMADKVMEVYDLDSDLLYAGVILHDIEKTSELDSNEFGITADYTEEGKLLGHIIMGIKLVERVGAQLRTDPDILYMIQHMIYCHHYEPEYDSPLKPMFKEAEMLHYLDVIDARMYDFTQAENSITTGNFSEKIWSLHSRQVYKPTLK